MNVPASGGLAGGAAASSIMSQMGGGRDGVAGVMGGGCGPGKASDGI